ncbi:hypothetical protein EOPP23_02475 [Endozoicomonas sp. OPT23]|uniref:glycoside hydrolase family 125 protein n=1 Tax=Endozoicomonas sp. OPT23 TaxID=2072845 RepID=UPI00129B9CBD|nr:glycoside hydrolase family 125 protein [Endozoicomonas sp. OPT23]MRI31861.1 hypothetical protein [Endozoicomonas sp. OPT23]
MKTRLCLCMMVLLLAFSQTNASVPDIRPATKKFTSEAVESYLLRYAPVITDKDLAQLFKNTFAYTLDNTVFYENVDQDSSLTDLRTYIVTGDIKAMWIRDSTNQLTPLAFLVPKDERLFRLFVGLVNSQSEFLKEDPFANAFVVPGGDSSPNMNDKTYGQFNRPGMQGNVYERKFEPDSLAAHLKLQRILLTSASGQQISELLNEGLNWAMTTTSLINLLTAWTEDATILKNPNSPFYYYFVRPGAGDLDTLKNGTGIPEKVTGMVRTLFRPSDDASKLPFNIPINSMLAYELSELAEIYQQLGMANDELRARMTQLSAQITEAINTYGTLQAADSNCQYSYEVDGFGSRFFIDDANYPSLLSLPLFAKGVYSEKCYTDTRPNILNQTSNPFYFTGEDSVRSGVGSPHTGSGRIWPLSLISQTRTSNDPAEKIELIYALLDSTGTTGLIHESYPDDSYSDYTRSDFGWGNAAFSELIVELLNSDSDLLTQIKRPFH